MRNIASTLVTVAALVVLATAATLVEPALWALVLGVGAFLPEAISGIEPAVSRE